MKKNQIIFGVIICIGLISSCINNSKKASIRADIKNLGNDSVYVMLNPYDEFPGTQFDTIVSEKGKFSLDTNINKLHHGAIISNKMYARLANEDKYFFRSKMIQFFIYPNESITITGEIKPNYTSYDIKGNDLNNQLVEYENSKKKLAGKSSVLMFELENHYLKNSTDSVFKSYYRKISEADDKMKQLEMDYIKNHPNNDISAFLLGKNRKDTIIRYYDQLSSTVQESLYGRLINARIQRWNNVEIGKTAPLFSSGTLNGSVFRLKDYRDKYLILDFWGTWCPPCMKGVPKMKEYYEKYSDKMEIVGIACRDNEKNLRNTVDKYDLNWIQILNNPETNDLSKLYGIEGYPTKIIIDPQGVISGIFLGETHSFYQKIDELFLN